MHKPDFSCDILSKKIPDSTFSLFPFNHTYK